MTHDDATGAQPATYEIEDTEQLAGVFRQLLEHTRGAQTQRDARDALYVHLVEERGVPAADVGRIAAQHVAALGVSEEEAEDLKLGSSESSVRAALRAHRAEQRRARRAATQNP